MVRRIEEVDSGVGTAVAEFAYDAAGNLTTDKDGYTYEYDCENRITKIVKSGPTTVAEFAYDALGRRIRKIDSIAGETTVYYHNDKWQVLCYYNGSGQWQRWFAYGNYIDEVLFTNTTTSLTSYKYYVHDHLYSPIALVNWGGTAAVERYEYDAYGNCHVLEPNFAADPDGLTDYSNPYLFTGRAVDTLDNSSLKTQYNRNRYYDQYTGRWTTHDPLGVTPNAPRRNRFAPDRQYKDGLNLYVLPRPNASGDPYGLSLAMMIVHAFDLCPICGPDITRKLEVTIDHVISEFNMWKWWQKESACLHLNHPGGWDIVPLWEEKYDGIPGSGRWRRGGGGYDEWVPTYFKNYCCPSPSCYGSVEVYGKCYKASSVNYVLYGLGSRLCYEYFDDPLYGSYSEDKMVMANNVRRWKALMYDEGPDQYEEALMWAFAGWDLAVPGDAWTLQDVAPEPRHYGHCETSCPDVGPDPHGESPFGWHWLGSPMDQTVSPF